MVAHNCHGKTKNLTAKTKYLTAKPKTSRQNQILHSKNKIALVLPWVFAFAVRYLVFAVKYLVLPWGLWFCREGFGFVVRYFVFAVRFSVLPWGILFLSWGFSLLVLPWQLWATVPATVNDAVLRTRKLWQDVGHVTYLSLLWGMGGWSHRSPNR